MVLKCLGNLALSDWRPPPGGPQAQTKTTSMICLKVNALRSYQPPLSNHWRSSSCVERSHVDCVEVA
jgi:hypothetical protein